MDVFLISTVLSKGTEAGLTKNSASCMESLSECCLHNPRSFSHQTMPVSLQPSSSSFAGFLYLPTTVALIAFFNYFYTFLQLDPADVSEQLKRQGASIPSVRPGKSTATFITNVSALTYSSSSDTRMTCVVPGD